MPKFDITPEKLRELYIDQGLTAKQIAEQHSLPDYFVKNRVYSLKLRRTKEQQDVSRRSRGLLSLTDDELRELYVNQSLPAKDIAIANGCSVNAVQARIHKGNIERSKEQRRAVRVKLGLDRRVGDCSDEKLRELYVDQLMSVNEIAKFLGMNRGCIGQRIKSAGIRHTKEQREKFYSMRKRGIAPKFTIGKDELVEKFVKQEMSVRDLMLHYKCSESVIYRHLNRYKLNDANLGVERMWRQKRKKYTTITQGYLHVYRKGHHKADTYGRVPEHIIIMEEAIGRPIAENEIVHHINMEKLDNSFNNLSVVHRLDHHSIHHYYQLCWLYSIGLRQSPPPQFNFQQLTFWAGSWVWWIDFFPQENKAVA